MVPLRLRPAMEPASPSWEAASRFSMVLPARLLTSRYLPSVREVTASPWDQMVLLVPLAWCFVRRLTRSPTRLKVGHAVCGILVHLRPPGVHLGHAGLPLLHDGGALIVGDGDAPGQAGMPVARIAIATSAPLFQLPQLLLIARHLREHLTGELIAHLALLLSYLRQGDESLLRSALPRSGIHRLA